MGRFARWRRQLFSGQRHLIDHGRIVAEFEVQLAAFRMGNGQHVAGKTIGDFDGVSESCIAGD
jgi:hypothetical protein